MFVYKYSFTFNIVRIPSSILSYIFDRIILLKYLKMTTATKIDLLITENSLFRQGDLIRFYIFLQSYDWTSLTYQFDCKGIMMKHGYYF